MVIALSCEHKTFSVCTGRIVSQIIKSNSHHYCARPRAKLVLGETTEVKTVKLYRTKIQRLFLKLESVHT
ncbi:hypothetical protein BDV29DRAFT_171688 [Aspergillus leporis]|jgi:hypothetical protein|uniref:Uncharacterized protein n=1 Tax=Aspergillus leporis TaxID=41062 RepID=A0A5N5X8E0_9EURO|nr:hypothetical protein BDV29DRAFT_171688 [Aspergillus leporis]